MIPGHLNLAAQWLLRLGWKEGTEVLELDGASEHRLDFIGSSGPRVVRIGEELRVEGLLALHSEK